jgi:hypothetical protein
MGDRAQVHVHYDRRDRTPVVLYTHWSGTELPEAVRTALKRGKSRWDDTAYLARIVFCDMVRGDENGETGFGIASHPKDADGDYRVIDLNCRTQVITFVGDWGEESGRSYSFAEFVGDKDAEATR